MGTVAEMFRAGGVWMYLLLTIAIFAIGVSVLSALAAVFVKKPMLLYAVGMLSVVLALAAPAVGFVGYSVGMSAVQDATEKAAPEHRARMVERGTEMASYPLKFGGIIAPIPLVVGLITIFVGVRHKQ